MQKHHKILTGVLVVLVVLSAVTLEVLVQNLNQLYTFRSLAVIGNAAYWAPYVAKAEGQCNYKAQNPTSTASGMYQFINSTWSAYSTQVFGKSYRYRYRAADAPALDQDKVFWYVWNSFGSHPWLPSMYVWYTNGHNGTSYKCGNIALLSGKTGGSPGAGGSSSGAGLASCKNICDNLPYEQSGSRDPNTSNGSSCALPNGKKGGCVSFLQNELNDAGCTDENGNKLLVDGVFGNLTRSALVSFQKEANITSDGIAGSITWGKINAGVKCTLGSSPKSGRQ